MNWNNELQAIADQRPVLQPLVHMVRVLLASNPHLVGALAPPLLGQDPAATRTHLELILGGLIYALHLPTTRCACCAVPGVPTEFECCWRCIYKIRNAHCFELSPQETEPAGVPFLAYIFRAADAMQRGYSDVVVHALEPFVWINPFFAQPFYHALQQEGCRAMPLKDSMTYDVYRTCFFGTDREQARLRQQMLTHGTTEFHRSMS